MRLSLFVITFLFFDFANAQTLGGKAAYTFLNLPASPLLSASGGINTSYSGSDVGLALNNPALLMPALHSDVGLVFNNYFAGIKAYNLSAAYHQIDMNTTFGGNIFFIDYGNIAQTDASGNVSGNFHPVDYVVQLSASKTYLEKWRYGASLKFISSDYGQYSSNALAMDVGIFYSDTSNNFSASVLVKNMGTQLKNYTNEKEDLPFDLQLGISKKLKKAPFGFSVTAHHLHQFRISYSDTTFNTENNLANNNTTLKNIFSHFVIATHIYAGKSLEATIGYNILRRQELNIGSSGNGLNGFSAGLQAKFKKLKIQYARSYFQRNIAYNQFGITISLKQLFGLESL